MHQYVAIVLTLLVGVEVQGRQASSEPASYPQVSSVSHTSVVVTVSGPKGATLRLSPGQQIGAWSFMGVVRSSTSGALAVFEDFSRTNGHLIFVSPRGLELDLPKSLEPTWAEPDTLYHGHTLEEVMRSEPDLLADELLAKTGDPQYAEVAACFPPISKVHTYTFVGTRDCFEKVGVFYGGGTPNFDPAAYIRAIDKIRNAGRVMDGLVGGWLPALRFVYPEQPGTWSELVIYAPMRVENDNARVQPVWYRLCRVETNALQWVRCFDSYHPFPPRMAARPAAFYEELLAMRAGWERALAGGMQIQIPDQRLANLARHSLVREMSTRVGPYPKYGVFDRGYGGSEHDGFPDTFTADTAAMLEWGLFGQASEYIDNYFAKFVRDDGSILYRGPETGQFGRMLTIAATYANFTHDEQLLLRYRRRLDAVAKLLLSLRAKGLALPADSPAHGLLAGWSEADACLDPDPARYMQPYLSNSSEAVRGFDELGLVWERIGRRKHLGELTRWGRELQQESSALNRDLQRAIARSILTNIQPPCLPAIAGVSEPFDVAVARDKLDPQFRSYRAYSEMLYSGNLTGEQVAMVVRYRAAHHDVILGIPTVYGYNTHEWGGFLSYGHAFGLLQHDLVREYLLTLYSLEAHQYTRGTWTAPETRLIDPKKYAAPYCTPAQMTVPLMLRWMLVFEDPPTKTLWLAKATPRDWLQDGQSMSISNAPTRRGRVGFELHSRLGAGHIEGRVHLPAEAVGVPIRLRLRVPGQRPIRSVLLNHQSWRQFDVASETISLPAGAKGSLELEVGY